MSMTAYSTDEEWAGLAQDCATAARDEPDETLAVDAVRRALLPVEVEMDRLRAENAALREQLQAEEAWVESMEQQLNASELFENRRRLDLETCQAAMQLVMGGDHVWEMIVVNVGWEEWATTRYGPLALTPWRVRAILGATLRATGAQP